jgi:hypothetical protein
MCLHRNREGNNLKDQPDVAYATATPGHEADAE